MNLFDEITKLIKDGEWHSVKEVLSKVGRKPEICLCCIEFLDRYELVQLDKAEDKVKVVPAFKTFLEEIEKLEG